MGRRQSLAQANAANIRRILETGEGSADIYRTTVAGPSGQRSDTVVGRIAYSRTPSFDLEVFAPDGPFTGELYGYAKRSTDRETAGLWAIYDDDPVDERIRLLGWTDSLALGLDIMRNGTHAARGNHDHARTSGGTWKPYVPAV